MKRVIFKIQILLVSLLTFCSCDDWLTLDPTSEIAASNFWPNAGADEYNAYMNGCYAQLRSDNQNIFFLGEMRSDNVMNGTNMGGEASQGSERFWQHTLSPVNAGVNNFGGFYTNINRINVFIKHTQDTLVNKQKITEEFRNTILGKAYGLRAFYYFQLLKSWGDAVINAEEDAIERAPSGYLAKKASPADEVMTFIKGDIQKSEQYFEEIVATPNEWSLAATLALKGEVYLWSAQRMNGGIEDAKEAETALMSIVSSRKFTLLLRLPTTPLEFTNFSTNNPFRAVFDYSNRGNEEVIFAIKYAISEASMSFITSYFLPQQTYLGSFYPDATTGVAFDKARENYNGMMRTALNPELLTIFYDNDTRKNVSIKDAYRKTDSGYDLQSVFLYKYQGTNDSGTRQMVDDYIVYRYADIILMVDEARALQGNFALSGVNTLRRRAFNVTTGEYNYPNAILDTGIYATTANWREIILRERQWEFIGEGKRWFDLVRMGNEYVKKYTNAVEDWQILMPIDQSSLILNPLLEQNPGYE